MKYYRRHLDITPQQEMHLEVDHYLEPIDLPESIEDLKLEWQQHNRDNGLSWNEVAELVNQVAIACEPQTLDREKVMEIIEAWLNYWDSLVELNKGEEPEHCILPEHYPGVARDAAVAITKLIKGE